MHIQDIYQRAVKIANTYAKVKYGKVSFEIGTPEHDYWLQEFDKAMRNLTNDPTYS